ncbi:MAG: hypothetical protein JOZ70_13895 [Pseudolabrys sp.]|nr:hypothetical protein [Pseudolabrys sp.]MBV9956330.1 hypothetical protein [Pseudolabrys sp.]
MTGKEIAAKKAKVYVLFGVAVACFAVDYFLPETTTAEILTGWAFIVAGVVCVLIAGKIAKSLKMESAKK